MLLVCVFLGLTIWYWATNWCALPWGGLFCSQHCLLSVVLCVGLKPSRYMQSSPQETFYLQQTESIIENHS